MVQGTATSGFKFNHTMIRVKDPKVSLKFYQDVLCMEFIDKLEFESFTLYYLAFDHSNGADTAEAKSLGRTGREGVLELTHNHGTESDPEFKGYSNGNSDPGRGFGHIAVSCDDVEAACARFTSLGVNFQKKLTNGKMKNIAFIKDPDDYWIEIVPGHRKAGDMF